MGLGAHGITISSAYRSADRATAAWSSICGVSMITTSSGRAISGTRRCRSRDGSATIRNGNASCGGASRGSMAARSDHSSALPDGSASTSSTVCPASANTCASQTAEVVLPVPGFRLAKARLRPVIKAVCQRPRHYRRQLRHAGGRCAHWNGGLPERDGPPAGRGTRAAAAPSRPVSGTAGWARWARRPAKLRLPAHFAGRTSPSPRPAVPTVPACWVACSRLAHLASRAVGKPAEPGRASAAGTVSPLCRNAVLQYPRHYGRRRRAGVRFASSRPTAVTCGPTRHGPGTPGRSAVRKRPWPRPGAPVAGDRSAGRQGNSMFALRRAKVMPGDLRGKPRGPGGLLRGSQQSGSVVHADQSVPSEDIWTAVLALMAGLRAAGSLCSCHKP